MSGRGGGRPFVVRERHGERAGRGHAAPLLRVAAGQPAEREAGEHEAGQHDRRDRNRAPRDHPRRREVDDRSGAQHRRIRDRLAEPPPAAVLVRGGGGWRGKRAASLVDERRRRPVAILGPLRQSSRHDRVQRLRQLGPALARPGRRLRDMGVEHRGLGLVRERHLAGQRLVEHGGERVEVAGRADGLTADLLRRRVVEGAEVLARQRRAAVAGALRQPEVGQVGAVAVDEDVLRLHVAVDEPRAVGGVERGRNVREQDEHALRLELAALGEPLQVGSLHEPHRHEEARLALARLVDGNDVRMLERRLQHRLAPEALAEAGVGAQGRREDLERNDAVERELRRLVDRAHATGAEPPLDPVPGDRRPSPYHQAPP